MLNERELNRRAFRRLAVLMMCGLILVIGDYIMSGMNNSVSFIKSHGNYYVIRPNSDDSTGHIRLKARVETDHKTISKSLNLSLSPYEIEEKPEDGKADDKQNSIGKLSSDELISYEINALTSRLNEDISVRNVKLPNRLSTGEKIHWSVNRNSNTAPIIFGMIVLAFIVYRRRLEPLKKQAQARNDCIARQLPEFINRIVLLLNAGLVLNHAFEIAIEDNAEDVGNDYFYSKMNAIYKRIKEANSSMTREFQAFARGELGTDAELSKELIRISNIFSDNISKGVELTEKLQHESEILWLNRKRNCEKRGHLAETKQTLPLTLLLLVLILITVSPALLEL